MVRKRGLTFCLAAQEGEAMERIFSKKFVLIEAIAFFLLSLLIELLSLNTFKRLIFILIYILQDMKKTLVTLLMVVMGTALLCSCMGNQEKHVGKKGSSGKTLEMILVANKDVYTGDTKQLIDSLFCHPQEGLMDVEPIFDLVNIPVSSFQSTEMFQAHRNIVICDIKADNPNKVYKHVDYWAAPQVVFEFAVKDRATLDSFLVKYAPTVVESMYAAEHQRIIEAFNDTKGIEIMDKVKEHFGFGLTFSNEFSIAKMTQNFAWIRKETKDFGIGVLVQTMPYTNESQFDENTILKNLDITMKQNVPGPADSSYMGTERRWDIAHKQITMAGQYCIESRGMWRTFGDFMGGPFVCYTLLSPDKKQVVMLTAYTYSPRNTNQTPYAKRDHLMQVESICHSITF